MLDYRISGLDTLARTLTDHRATHLVSLVDPGAATPARPDGIDQRLVLQMHDLDRIDDGGLPGNPAAAHLMVLLDFARDHLADGATRVVFQCTAGRRRSTAAALICDLVLQRDAGLDLSAGAIQAGLDRLKKIRPIADPNRALVALADQYLDLKGILTQAVDAAPRYLDLTADL